MDPTEKNWVSRYLQLRIDFSLPVYQGEIWTHSKKLYKYLQPTGIIYGHPIEIPKEIELDYTSWPIKERFEVIFMESLLSSYLFYNQKNEIDIAVLNSFVLEANEFYKSLFPEFFRKSLFETKAKNNEQQLERILSKRISVKPEWNAQFWRGFFHNILLFLDVIVFVEYLQAKNSDSDFDTKQRFLQLQKNIIDLLAIVANINCEPSIKNDNFLDFFIDSTTLDKKEKESIRDNISKPQLDSVLQYLSKSEWLVKKYFLELAILSIWADNKVNIAEKDFIDNLSNTLKLSETDIHESSFAVESFVLLHWQQVHYLQSKQNYLVLSKRLTQRMISISKKYAAEIKNEIHEDKELLELLKISQRRPLSINEKEKVRAQLIDILKTIPAFVILTLPLSFLTVPILMKILPKSLFPSSFDANKLMAPRTKNFVQE